MTKVKLLFALILILPVIFWLVVFVSQPVSNDSSDWANFGSYFGGVITSISIPITLYYVLKTYTSQKELERISKISLVKTEFDNRWFELVRVFNDFRLTQVEAWTEQQDKPDTREYFKGLKWFLYHRRKYQSKFIELQKSDDEYGAHKRALQFAVNNNNLAFEYYFRSIETLIKTIEVHHTNIIAIDPSSNSDRANYLQLLSTLLTNDQMFFIKYCNDIEIFQGKFPLVKKNVAVLTSDMYKDYRLSPE